MSVTAASSDGIEKRTSLVVSLDDALLALAEVMKTLIRESFHLGGQVVNGFASTALHLTFEPGYLTRVRHRFTVCSQFSVLVFACSVHLLSLLWFNCCPE